MRGRVTPGYLDATGRLNPIVNAEGFLPTGDLGSVDDDGWLHFTGRMSEMIKAAGARGAECQRAVTRKARRGYGGLPSRPLRRRKVPSARRVTPLSGSGSSHH